MPASASEPASADHDASTRVLVCSQSGREELDALAGRYGADVIWLPEDASIRGSYWGEREAGLVQNRLYVRPDTPVHSALHELCHYVCMRPDARAALDTNAGGDYDEENAVCFLQIILAAFLPSCGRQRMLSDMDAWGYTFRLGSAAAWFERDAEDARLWLESRGLIDARLRPTWSLRDSA